MLAILTPIKYSYQWQLVKQQNIHHTLHYILKVEVLEIRTLQIIRIIRDIFGTF